MIFSNRCRKNTWQNSTPIHGASWVPPVHLLISLQFPDEFDGHPSGSPHFNNIPCKWLSIGFLASPARVSAGFLESSKCPPSQAACWIISSVLQQIAPCPSALTHQLWTRFIPTLLPHLSTPEFGSVLPFQLCSSLEYSPSALGWCSLEDSFISS